MVDILILILVGAIAVGMMWAVFKIVAVVFSKLFFTVEVPDVILVFIITFALFYMGVVIMTIYYIKTGQITL